MRAYPCIEPEILEGLVVFTQSGLEGWRQTVGGSVKAGSMTWPRHDRVEAGPARDARHGSDGLLQVVQC